MRRIKQMQSLLVAIAMLLLMGGYAEEQKGVDFEFLPREDLGLPVDVPVDEPLPTAEVVAPVPVTLTLDQHSVNLDYSQSMTLTATASSGGGLITWSSSDANVVSLSAGIGESVTIVGIQAGTATITCSLGNLRQTCEVKVNAPNTLQITGVDYPATFRIGQGGWRVRNGTVASTVDLATLTTVIKDAGGETVGNPYIRTFGRGVTRFDVREIDRYISFAQISTEGTYTWTISATDVNGRSVSMSLPVNAVTEGATIVSNNSGVYSSILFSSSIALSNTVLTLPLGATKPLAATIMPPNAIDNILVWTSTDPSVATVSPNGEVTTVGLGTTSIQCKALYNNEVSASCVVIVDADAVSEGIPAENTGSMQVGESTGAGINIISRSLMDMSPKQIAEPGDVIRSGYGWAYAENSGDAVGRTLKERLALRTNTTYTVSFVAWAGEEVQMNVDLYPDSLPETRVDLTSTPTRYTWTFYSSSPDMNKCSLRFFKAGGFETWVNVVDVKLERGEVATDWSAAIGDSEGQYEAITGDGINLISRTLMDMAPDKIADLSAVIHSGYGWAYAANSGDIVGQTLKERLELQQNTEYTVSFVAWAGAEEQMNVDLYPDTLPQTNVILTSVPTRYTWTFYSDSPDMNRCSLRFFRAGGFETWVNVVDVKLERGGVATDWSAGIGDERDGVNLISRSLMDKSPDQIADPNEIIHSGYGWAYAANSGSIVGQTQAEQLALQQNTKYTVSFVAWAGTEERMSVDLYPDTLPETIVDLTPTPTRYTWTFYSSSPDMKKCSLRFFKTGGFETWVNVVDVKLERGNVATDWSEPLN